MKGLYRHYKGNYYRVIGEARHSESEECFVLYHPVSTPDGYWVRPKAMFFELVTVDGEMVPRFRFVGEDDDAVETSSLD